MDLFESVNRLLRDKHTLMEATSETFKFDSAIDIFKQIVKDHQAMYVKSLGEGKYEGQYDRKKGYILIDAQSANYAVKVYEATTDDTRKKLDKISLEKYLTLINNLRNKSLKESVENFEVGIYPREDADDAEYAVYDKKSKTWSDFQGNVSEKSKQTAKKIADKYNKGINESKDLEPMKTFKVTYHDGSSYKTSARAKSEEDFKKYLTQDGPWIVTDEDDETGEETKKKIVKVEMLKESLDNQTEKIVLSKSLPAYFEAMLWSSNDQDDNPLDKNYSISDISDKLRESSKKDLLSFVKKCEKECSEELEEYISDKGREKFGHDFWLSRNGHGAGFFDDGFNKLQKLANSFKEVDVYVTDDGEIDA